jgi:hypothetical protein
VELILDVEIPFRFPKIGENVPIAEEGPIMGSPSLGSGLMTIILQLIRQVRQVRIIWAGLQE